jgi:hypothetical protein
LKFCFYSAIRPWCSLELNETLNCTPDLLEGWSPLAAVILYSTNCDTQFLVGFFLDDWLNACRWLPIIKSRLQPYLLWKLVEGLKLVHGL